MPPEQVRSPIPHGFFQSPRWDVKLLIDGVVKLKPPKKSTLGSGKRRRVLDFVIGVEFAAGAIKPRYKGLPLRLKPCQFSVRVVLAFGFAAMQNFPRFSSLALPLLQPSKLYSRSTKLVPQLLIGKRPVACWDLDDAVSGSVPQMANATTAVNREMYLWDNYCPATL
jgi:hypothetical protein